MVFGQLVLGCTNGCNADSDSIPRWRSGALPSDDRSEQRLMVPAFMTPELKDQLDARIAELIAAMTPAQHQHMLDTGRYKQIPEPNSGKEWETDDGWTGEGTLQYRVTEYVGPSELPEDNGAEKPGAEGMARFTDVDGTIWRLSKDFSTQPSRNRDWTLADEKAAPA